MGGDATPQNGLCDTEDGVHVNVATMNPWQDEPRHLNWCDATQSASCPSLSSGANRDELDESDPLFVPAGSQNGLLPSQQSIATSRYRAILNTRAATAQRADNVPVTYLDYDQIYTVRVIDLYHQPGTCMQYLTFVQISFNSPQQQLYAATCWHQWMAARRAREIQLGIDRFRAIECVGMLPSDSTMEAVDDLGFCVGWSSTIHRAECSIRLRFHFLSTDFNYSKGHRGAIMHLNVRTQALTDIAMSSTSSCLITVFQAGGAARKFAQEVSRAKNRHAKISTQISKIATKPGSSVARKKRLEYLIRLRTSIDAMLELRTTQKTGPKVALEMLLKQSDTAEENNVLNYSQRLRDTYLGCISTL